MSACQIDWVQNFLDLLVVMLLHELFLLEWLLCDRGCTTHNLLLLASLPVRPGSTRAKLVHGRWFLLFVVVHRTWPFVHFQDGRFSTVCLVVLEHVHLLLADAPWALRLAGRLLAQGVSSQLGRNTYGHLLVLEG